jgi:putative transposase
VLREAQVLLCQGSAAVEVARKLGVTEETYYRWRREYGGTRIEQAKRSRELEKEKRGSRISSPISAWTTPF